MTDALTRTCSRIGCPKTFSVTPRIGHRQQRRYCSDACRVRDHRTRKPLPEPLQRLQNACNGSLGTKVANEPLHPVLGLINQGSKQPLQMTFGAYTVVPDPDWPKKYRIRSPDGTLQTWST